MSLTNFPNGLSSFGIPLPGGSIPMMFGTTFFVDYTNGRDAAPRGWGVSMAKAYKTLSAAYAACNGGKNERILINGVDHVQESAMITWAKNKIHVFGLGPFGVIDPRPEIQLSAVANTEDNAATMKVTGYGNSFTNITIFNSGTHGNSVTALWDAGENNVYTNCQFAKGTDLNVATVSDVEGRGDSTTWRHCKFGIDWVVQSAARPTLWIKGTGAGARMKHNFFEDCYFVCASSAATKVFIKVYDTLSLAFNNVWKNPIFLNAIVGSISAAALNDAITSVTGLTEGNLLFVNPVTNTLELCSANTTGVKVQGPGMSLDGGATAVGETLGTAITPA